MSRDVPQNDGLRRVPLGSLIRDVRGGVSPPCEDRSASQGEHGVLTLSSVSDGVLRPDENKVVMTAYNGPLGPSLRAGTVLMSRSNTAELVGMTAFIDQDHPNRHLPDLIWELTVADCDPEWLACFLQTRQARRELQSRAAGTSGSMKK